MRASKTIQFFLLGLIAIGVFASMARNTYGATLIGLACFSLSLLYLAQLILKFAEDYSAFRRNEIIAVVELLALSVLLILFGCRALYIYLPVGDLIFISVGVLLIITYVVLARVRYSENITNKSVAVKLGAYHLSIALFLVSMLIRSNETWSISFGIADVVLALPFFISVLGQQKFEYQSQSTTLFQIVTSAKNKSGVMFLFFITSSLLVALTYLGITPPLENTTRPKAYIELINKAESGNEKPLNGKFQHEKYREAMEKFLDRHGKK